MTGLFITLISAVAFWFIGKAILKAIYGTSKGSGIAHEREIRKRARQAELGFYNGRMDRMAAERAAHRLRHK